MSQQGSMSMMELYIETLTGVLMELMVHPYETVYNVKAKINRLEGRWLTLTDLHGSLM